MVVPWGPWVGVGSVHLSQPPSLRKAQLHGASPGCPPCGTGNRTEAPLLPTRPVWRQPRVPHGEASYCPITVSTGTSQRGGWEAGMAQDMGSRPHVCDRGKVIGPLCLSFLFSKGRKAGVKGGCTQHCGHQPVTQAAVTAPWMGC